MKTIEISELIKKVRKELEKYNENPKVFYIQEIHLEISFIINNDLNGEINLGVVTAESNIAKQKVQKISLTLVPIFSKEELINKTPQSQVNESLRVSQRILFKGEQLK